MAERYFGNKTTLVQLQAPLPERGAAAVMSGSILRYSRVLPDTEEQVAGAVHEDVPSVGLLAPDSWVGRFRIGALLGAGGTGAVYQAVDGDTGRPAAVKVLHNLQAARLVAFKSEFRVALRLAHRNLLTPYELATDQERWFIAMELVDGWDFLRYVRSEAGYDHRRLRDGLLQVVAGLEALHGAGVIHRDLKPANVLVARDGGVRIVDFGLALLRDAQHSWVDEAGRAVGSPAYMAPEQAAGETLSVEADLYGVGAMLFEALTGRVPFEGPVHALLLQKLACDARDPREMAPDVPDDLAELALALLSRTPAERPALSEIRAVLQDGTVHDSSFPPAPRAELVGRGEELALFERAFEERAADKSALLLLAGRSGVGKSALLRTATERLAAQGALVLHGACHELESIPFKGFESAVDELRGFLRTLQPESRQALLPANFASAAAMFPVLRDFCPQFEPAAGAADTGDRDRGYRAIKDTLQNIARQHRLVLALDDVHWGDRDGSALLSYLMSPNAGPLPALFVLAYRPEETERSEFLRGVSALRAANSGMQTTLIQLEPLASEFATELASSLLDRVDPELARRIAEESCGEPFLVEQLAQHAAGPVGPRGLLEVIAARADALDPDALRLVEIAAVAGQPVPQALIESCLGLSDCRQLVSQLVSLSLLRRASHTQAGLLYPYHDRIRDVVAGSLSASAKLQLHLLLASHAERGGLLPASALVDHFVLGGASERALPHALSAAAAAENALAFDLAADTFARALRLSGDAGPGSLPTRVAHARCLHRAGRCAEAGAAYVSAALLADGRQRQLLQSGAIEAWLACGRLESALEALRPLLASIGSSYPDDTKRILAELLVSILRAKLSLLRKPRVPASREGSRAALQADLLWGAGKGLMPIATPQAAVLCFRSLRAALSSRDAHRVGRALAFIGSGFVPLLEREGERCLRWANELVEEHADDHLRVMVSVAQATRAFLKGAWSASIEGCERVLALAPRCSAPTAWEESVAHTVLVSGHEYRGTLRAMEEGCVRCLQTLRSRGDQITAVTVVSAHGYVHAARHDAEGLDRLIREMTAAMEGWTVSFGTWDFYRLRLQTLRALCWGDVPRARQLLDALWPQLRRHHLLRTPIVRGPALALRASVLIEELATAPRPGSGLRQEVQALAAALAREPRQDARVHGALAEAFLCHHDGRDRQRDASLARCEEHARQGDLRVVARMIGRLRAQLTGCESLRMQLETELDDHGVKEASAWARFVTPGFSQLGAPGG
jgi:hypothetical protein